MAAPDEDDHCERVIRASVAQSEQAKVRSGMIRLLHQWWLAHQDGDIPDRAQLDPEEFKYMLSHMLISEVVHNPFRIRYRLAGSAVIAVRGLNITGHYLDELLPSDDEPWMEHYALAYDSREPVFGTAWLMSSIQVRYRYDFAIFPLRNGGTDVEQFVSMEDYFDFAGPVDDLVGWRLRSNPSPA